MSTGSSRGSNWNRLRAAVLERDQYTCAYCGREATEADHVVAKANGGKDVLENLVAACRTCNAAKGARQVVRTNWFNQKWLDSL